MSVLPSVLLGCFHKTVTPAVDLADQCGVWGCFRKTIVVYTVVPISVPFRIGSERLRSMMIIALSGAVCRRIW